MPRYFFHLRDESRFLTDEDGVELSDIVTARAEARRWGEVILEGAGITAAGGPMVIEIWSETEPLELVVINRHVTRGKAHTIH